MKKMIPYYSVIYKSNLINSIEQGEVYESVPCDFKLNQNYPNPFNGSTKIRFQLKGQQKVSLIIYDITGKEVIRLVDDIQFNSGEHELIWNGTNKTGKEVSSGVYILRLVSQGYQSAIKMILAN